MNMRSIIRQIFDKIFRRKRNSKQLLADLNHFTPDYCKKIVEKYGNENWALTAQQFSDTMNKAQLSYFEYKLQTKE